MIKKGEGGEGGGGEERGKERKRNLQSPQEYEEQLPGPRRTS